MASEIFTKEAGSFQLSKLSVQEGKLEAVITSYGNFDVVNDVIKRGALDEFIKNFNGGLPMLYMHDTKEIIGEWDKIYEKGDLVMATGMIFPEVSRGKDAMALISRGQIGSTSIGFTSSDFTKNARSGYDFNKIELIETSLVARPANNKAEILSAKRDDGSVDFKAIETALRDAGLSRKESKAFVSEGKSALRDAIEMELKSNDMLSELKRKLGDI